MSCVMSCSHGMALATATVMAVSGTVILLALCRPRLMPTTGPSTQISSSYLRPCISISGERKLGKKKRVRFGEDVVVEIERFVFEEEEEIEEAAVRCEERGAAAWGKQQQEQEQEEVRKMMPANRAALYNGMMQDRIRLQRRTMACY